MLTALPALISVPGTAQTGKSATDIEQEFQRAMVDSAMKLELLKPRLYSLQKSNYHLEQQVIAGQNERRFMSFQHQVEVSKFELQLADQPKKNKRWLAAGFVGGLIIGALITK